MTLMEKNNLDLYQKNNIQLKEKIKLILEKETGAKYIGSLQVFCEDDVYTLRLGNNSSGATLVSIGFAGTEPEFLDFLKIEFRKKKLQDVTYTSSKLINGDSFIFCPIIEL